MKLICWLAMSLPTLAQDEIQRLIDGTRPVKHDDVLLLTADDWQAGQRAAYTRAIYEYWWGGPVDKLWEHIDGFAWRKYVNGSFAVNLHHAKGVSAKQVADRVAHHLDDVQVNLRKPDTPIALFFVDDVVICGKFLWANKEKFQDRRPHLRKHHRPVACHPRIGRAMLNLTGAPKGARVLDPFCGTGTLLIEAALLGLHPAGSDASKDMIAAAKGNCDEAQLECELNVRDATHLYAPEKYVVADLPYGRGSGKKSTKELEELYVAFLDRLSEFLRVRAVIATPMHIKTAKLAHAAGLKVVAEYEQFVHASLSRRILVLEPKKQEE